MNAHLCAAPSRWIRFVVLAVTVALAAAGCSSSGSKASGNHSTSGGTGSVDRARVLRMAFDLSGNSGSAPTFDPTHAKAGGADVPWQLPVYDSLLHFTTSGKLVPSLATKAEIVDPQTVAIELRNGLVFSDGTPLDANAVKASILRNRDAPRNGQFQPSLYEVSAIDVSSPTSLTVHMNKPSAGIFYGLLGSVETFVYSTKAPDPARMPIGAGPFMVKDFVPTQRITLVKNPKYWDAANIQLAGIDIVSVPGGPQQVNSIKSGTVDFTVVQVNDAPAIRSNTSLKLISRGADNSLMWMPLCKTTQPLDKVEVRQALSYAIDRVAINKTVLQGLGEPASGLWPKSSVFSPKSLDGYYTYRPDKAKQLLREAGVPNGFKTSLILIPGLPYIAQTAQIIQQEWKAIGVDVDIKQSTNYVTDLYVNRAPTGINPTINPGLAKFNPFRPGNIGDLCGYQDPKIDQIATKINGLAPTSPDAVQLWADAQEIIVKQALVISLDFLPLVVATTNKVADANIVGSYLIAVPDYHTIHLTK